MQFVLVPFVSYALICACSLYSLPIPLFLALLLILFSNSFLVPGLGLCVPGGCWCLLKGVKTQLSIQLMLRGLQRFELCCFLLLLLGDSAAALRGLCNSFIYEYIYGPPPNANFVLCCWFPYVVCQTNSQ